MRNSPCTRRFRPRCTLRKGRQWRVNFGNSWTRPSRTNSPSQRVTNAAENDTREKKGTKLVIQSTVVVYFFCAIKPIGQIESLQTNRTRSRKLLASDFNKFSRRRGRGGADEGGQTKGTRRDRWQMSFCSEKVYIVAERRMGFQWRYQRRRSQRSGAKWAERDRFSLTPNPPRRVKKATMKREEDGHRFTYLRASTHSRRVQAVWWPISN